MAEMEVDFKNRCAAAACFNKGKKNGERRRGKRGKTGSHVPPHTVGFFALVKSLTLIPVFLENKKNTIYYLKWA